MESRQVKPRTPFTLAVPTRKGSSSSSSSTSSETTSPTLLRPEDEHEERRLEAELIEGSLETKEIALGRLDDAQYEKLLPRWRDCCRRMLLRHLEQEMNTLEWIQTSLRTPKRDSYFVQTSLLGTHSFFMICVPMPFWFGHGRLGRGLLYVLAAGGYTTSVLKDLFCVPRPFSPPLVRLSVGNHALEYGFPSTHSTTTVSMALYFGELLWRNTDQFSIMNGIVYALLTIICVSVVFGRLYTGMHSIMDVTVGSIFGILCWVAYWLLEDAIEHFTLNAGHLVPLLIVPSTLFLVFVHPAPAEDCPCFEDAVAFLSVVAGIVLGHHFYPSEFEGTTLAWNGGNQWRGRTVFSVAILGKLVLGVLTIFTWRLVAKEVCHAILPPIFRFFSSFLLPRRHYLTATEYGAYKTDGQLHPIPSILDLPSLNEIDSSPNPEEGLSTSSSFSSPILPHQLRNRSINSTEEKDPLVQLRKKKRIEYEENGEKISKTKKDGDRVRRDADVLTKVFVYSGIGWFATIGIPYVFEVVGLTIPTMMK